MLQLNNFSIILKFVAAQSQTILECYEKQCMKMYLENNNMVCSMVWKLPVVMLIYFYMH